MECTYGCPLHEITDILLSEIRQSDLSTFQQDFWKWAVEELEAISQSSPKRETRDGSNPHHTIKIAVSTPKVIDPAPDHCGEDKEEGSDEEDFTTPIVHPPSSLPINKSQTAKHQETKLLAKRKRGDDDIEMVVGDEEFPIFTSVFVMVEGEGEGPGKLEHGMVVGRDPSTPSHYHIQIIKREEVEGDRTDGNNEEDSEEGVILKGVSKNKIFLSTSTASAKQETAQDESSSEGLPSKKKPRFSDHYPVGSIEESVSLLGGDVVTTTPIIRSSNPPDEQDDQDEEDEQEEEQEGVWDKIKGWMMGQQEDIEIEA